LAGFLTSPYRFYIMAIQMATYSVLLLRLLFILYPWRFSVSILANRSKVIYSHKGIFEHLYLAYKKANNEYLEMISFLKLSKKWKRLFQGKFKYKCEVWKWAVGATTSLKNKDLKWYVELNPTLCLWMKFFRALLANSHHLEWHLKCSKIWPI